MMARRFLTSVAWMIVLLALVALGAFIGLVVVQVTFWPNDWPSQRAAEDRLTSAMLFWPVIGALVGIAATGGLRLWVRRRKSHN